MNILEKLSFKYKLFIPLIFTMFVIGIFLWQNYKLSNFIEKQLLSINKHEIWVNTLTQSISRDINDLTIDFTNKALQKKVDDDIRNKTDKTFAHINEQIKRLQKSSLFKEQKLHTSLENLQNRLRGYYAILLDLPEAYEDSPEDAIYTIISLGSVNNKIQDELHLLLSNSKKQLNQKILSIQKIVADNKKTNIMTSAVAILILIVFNLFIIFEFLGSIRTLKEFNRSFYDFLHGRISKVKEITHFPEDEIGQILHLINDNTKQAESLIAKERELSIKINQLNNTLEERVQNALVEIRALNTEIEDTQREVIFTMGSIGESRSKETGNHVRRVAEYSKLLALLYGLDEKEAQLIKEASPMHDIGKVAIPDHILNKPGRLTKEEFTIMQTHAQLGYDMLKHSNRPILKTAAIIAYEHHEKYNGKGYPNGLKGDDIHIYGQITAIADVFDALGSDRVYKKAWSLDKILKLFKEERGEHFNPKLVDLFFDNIDKFLAIRDEFADLKHEDEASIDKSS